MVWVPASERLLALLAVRAPVCTPALCPGSSSASKYQGQKTDSKGNLDKNHFILALSWCPSANPVSRLRAVFDSVQTPHYKLRGKQSQMCMESKVSFQSSFSRGKERLGNCL